VGDFVYKFFISHVEMEQLKTRD